MSKCTEGEIYATPADLATKYLICRTRRHQFFEIPPPMPRRGTIASIGRQYSERCDRCGTEKHEVWSRTTGQLMTRQYIYPKDYYRLNREIRADDLRFELLRRWTREGKYKRSNPSQSSTRSQGA